MVENLPVNAGDLSLIPGSGRSPGVEMATRSSILAWKIPWTKEPGRRYSPWDHKESDMSDRMSTHARLERLA